MIITRAKQVTASMDNDAPVFYKELILENFPKSAVIEICGLGYFEAAINGIKITDDKLIPNPSIYEKRYFRKLLYPVNDRFTYRTYYLRYDITGFLRPGINRFEVICGNGWYNQRERVIEGDISFGRRPKLIFATDISTADGKTVRFDTDGSESWSESIITYSNIFIGETHDFNRTGLTEKKPVVTIPDSKTCYTLSDGVNDRAIRKIYPVSIYKCDEYEIFDAGENISGIVEFDAAIPCGKRIEIRYSEVLNEDKTALDFISTGSLYICGSGTAQIQTDTVIGDGKLHHFEPKFVYHTFRYFEVRGGSVSPVVVVIHSDVSITSDFHSNNMLLNWYYDAYIRTQLDNMHGSYPSDCPHRERLGYTGDGQLTCESAMLTLDSGKFYRKWIRDIADCQDTETGRVQNTAPFMGGGGAPVPWGGAIVIVPYRYYITYGDSRPLYDNFDRMDMFVKYISSHTKNGLVSFDDTENNMFFLGDWLAYSGAKLPPEYINTCSFIEILDILSEIAEITGKGNKDSYLELADRYRKNLKETYMNNENGSYFEGEQGADAYACSCGIGDYRTVNLLTAKYSEKTFIDTGMLGTPVLIGTLFRLGYGALAYKLLTAPTDNSLFRMMDSGATTLYETLDNKEDGSRCHPVFGSCIVYLFRCLLGINPGKAGYEKIILKPFLISELEIGGRLRFCNGSINVDIKGIGSQKKITVVLSGSIECAYEKSGKLIKLRNGINTIEDTIAESQSERKHTE